MSPYCPSCGDAIEGTENFCPECGVQIGGSQEPATGSVSQAGPPPSDKWHFGVASPALAVAGWILLTFMIGFMEGATGSAFGDYYIEVISGLWGFSILVTAILAPISVYFDKKYLKQSIGWEPSSLYYTTAIPLLNIIIAIGYLWQRHKAEKASTGDRQTAPIP